MAQAHHGSPASTALARILSSMSVTFRMSVTRLPDRRSQRTRTSNATADRRCPMCGADCTVAPHRWTPTSPGTSGTKSRTVRVAESKRRRVTRQGYRGGTGPGAERASDDRPERSAEVVGLAAVRRDGSFDRRAPDEVHRVEALHALARLGVPEPDAVADPQVGATGEAQRGLDLAGPLAVGQRQPGGPGRTRLTGLRGRPGGDVAAPEHGGE